MLRPVRKAHRAFTRAFFYLFLSLIAFHSSEIKEYWLRRSGLWEEDIDEVDRRLPVQDQTVTNSVDAIAKLQAYYAQNKAKSPILNDDEQEREIGSDSNQTTNQLALIEEEMQQLRSSLAEIQSEGQALRAKREAIDQETKSIEQVVERLKEEKKVKERTHILLENPEVNIAKLEAIIVAAGEKMKKLQSQWETHQAPLLAKLEEHRGRSSDSEVSSSAISIEHSTCTKLIIGPFGLLIAE